MADAIIASVAEMLIITAKEHIESEIQLVRGVEKELLNLSDKLKAIRNVLDDAERRRYKDKGVNDWVVRLEQTSHEMEDVLEEWSYALLQHNIQQHHQLAAAAAHHHHRRKDKLVCFPILTSCLCFKKVAFRRDIAVKVQNLKAKLEGILNETDRYEFVMSQLALSESWRVQSTSRFDSSEVRGRKHDNDFVVRKVMAHDHRTREELGLRVISIVGAGGLGKKTLAQLVYNDSRVKDCFDLSWDKPSSVQDLEGYHYRLIQHTTRWTSLRVLGLWNDFPQGMDKLIHLKWLSIDHCVLSNKDLKTICKLYYLQALFIRSCILIEVPKEIGNLIHLRHLDLSNNRELKELSESVCGLLELRTLDIEGCISLCRLPKEIHRLKNLNHLHNMYSVMELPQSVAKLTGLRRLSEFNGGSGGSKMGWLKNLRSG